MSSLNKKLRFETLAVHAGHKIDPSTGAVVAPIHMSTTFERDVDGGYARGFMYSRNHNPNRNALEDALSALEGGGRRCGIRFRTSCRDCRFPRATAG